MLSRIAHAPITSYLDFGTGDGTIAKSVGDAIGMDPSNIQGVDVFEMKRSIPTLVIEQGQRLPQSWNGKFQLITAFQVLHHTVRQREAIEDLYRVLAPGGLLILREHDFWDMRTPPTLKSENNVRVRNDVVNGSFYHFLDAIHISSMALVGDELSHSEGGSFYSHYRGRYDWHLMLQMAGF